MYVRTFSRILLTDFVDFIVVEKDRTVGSPYHALAAILRSPWWQRVWTLQEHILSRGCIAFHGRKHISMSALLCYFLDDEFSLLTEGSSHFNHNPRQFMRYICMAIDSPSKTPETSNQFNKQAGELVLERLFHMAFLLKAKNPVDKIYGLYGILTQYCSLKIPEPDYKKPVEEVYKETTWAWIDSRHDLSILKLAARSEHFENLPSWVPAWYSEHPSFGRSETNANINPATTFQRHIERYAEFDGGHFSWKYMFNDHLTIYTWRDIEEMGPIASLSSDGQLRIFKARRIGKVAHAIGVDRPGDYYGLEKGSYLSTHVRWCGLVHDVFSATSTDYEDALVEMLRTLDTPGIFGFREDEDTVKEGFRTLRAWFEYMLRLHHTMAAPAPMHSPELEPVKPDDITYVNAYMGFLGTRKPDDAIAMLREQLGGISKSPQEMVHMAKSIHEVHDNLIRVRNYSFCLLEDTHMMALANYWCSEGDEIFVFPDTDCPFVLRKEPDTETYRLIGPALVDRIRTIGYQTWRTESEDLQDVVLV
jgi:hypothetical protein